MTEDNNSGLTWEHRLALWLPRPLLFGAFLIAACLSAAYLGFQLFFGFRAEGPAFGSVLFLVMLLMAPAYFFGPFDRQHPMRTATGTVSLLNMNIQPRRQPAIYVTVKNANVRAGPSTGAARITTLRKGTRVTVLGTAASGDWFRIARGGKALGYVYAPLIAPR